MGMFNGGLGLSEFIFQKLNRFKEHLSIKNQDRIASFIENTVYFFSVAGPIMTIPQVFQLYTTKTATGLSMVTWGSYLAFAFFWITYGVFIKNKPIVFANFLWIIMNGSIVVGIYLYG